MVRTYIHTYSKTHDTFYDLLTVKRLFVMVQLVIVIDVIKPVIILTGFIQADHLPIALY